jgi:hypothetical protein
MENHHLSYIYMLVGALEHEFYDCPYTGNVIIPTEELIFFRGVAQPPTRCAEKWQEGMVRTGKKHSQLKT